jgi:chemotaxis protein methyltransferase CheR
MVIGVTSFFRDPGVFDDLRQIVLPVFLGTSRPLRLWSAGCSDGAELYSIAILLDELDLLRRCDLLGTDCLPGAIDRAREGSFAADVLQSMIPSRIDRHFVRESAGCRVAGHLRDAAAWRVADVTRAIEPGSWDIILCRNLPMYLRPEHAGRLWQRLAQALRPGGCLVVGKAEHPGGKLNKIAPCIYRREHT